ncbi:synaptobrevin homolog YKT6 [Dermacentor andersoni]|uniref:synaptobrevin homolog YKT6 n=1 Tax=Dermacentor andersoni TaxID=34620 RepID=UPI0021555E10|nr:synaptobrevin homolog YKT6-like [Dermacentor andersoni]XP_050049164.1 synaptobrevin homolog YKT6-like [Dermacentor andersoni]
MVKLFHIAVLYKHPTKGVILKCASEVSSFSFFQRSSVVEFLKFSSQIIVSRSCAATRSSVREREYMCHVYVRSDSLAGVVVSDHEYPSRVAHTLLNKVLDDFASKIPAHTWSSLVESTCQYQGLEAYLAKYQVPTEADAMTKIQADLDETKIILHNTIEAVLERGEKLDDLVAKSEDLSMQSKTFYKTARKTNQCCTIL